MCEIVIDFEGVKAINLESYLKYVIEVMPQYGDYFLKEAGEEHYKLLAYMASKFETPVVDLGTLFGSSAVALKSHTTAQVYTYDIMDHVQNVRPDAVLSHKQMQGITLIIKDCNKDIKEMLALEPELILLDIDPHDGKQEETFYDLLKEHDFKGLLMCDDINLNDGMKSWWQTVTHEKHDLTKYGHWSGTGLVNFNPDKYKIVLA
jgi:predicted O-methyltransferase YrrM